MPKLQTQTKIQTLWILPLWEDGKEGDRVPLPPLQIVGPRPPFSPTLSHQPAPTPCLPSPTVALTLCFWTGSGILRRGIAHHPPAPTYVLVFATAVVVARQRPKVSLPHRVLIGGGGSPALV